LRSAGIQNINVDLIAGLPHQTSASWDDSLAQAVALEVPHVSVYILEVDEDSRLGRELIAGGQKYHAHHVPDADLAAELYERACQLLDDACIRQYEISNFARAGFESRHNLKYWTRVPYFGFGLDAHSMLLIPANTGADGSTVAIRLANPVELEDYLEGTSSESIRVTLRQAIEEELFLGLRLNRGINPADISERLGVELPKTLEAALAGAIEDGLLMRSGKNLALTPRGRLLSNEVFVRFLDSSRQPLEAR
jgi:oxygen-independent coproporphyrinogen-3 oxidase